MADARRYERLSDGVDPRSPVAEAAPEGRHSNYLNFWNRVILQEQLRHAASDSSAWGHSYSFALMIGWT